MIKRILVPVDGSEFAEAALEPALALAETHGAELHLASVVSSAPPVPMAYADEEIISRFMEDQEARVREYVDKLAERAASVSPGVTVATHVGVGRVSRTVQSIAREIGADLLVLTTHGRGAFQRAWLGSIADQLLRRIEKPILLLPRPKEGQRPVDLNGIRHALVPLDGSGAAEGVLDALSLVIQPDSGCRVTLAGVVDDEVSLPGVYLPHLISEEAFREQQRRKAEQYLAGAAEQLKIQGFALVEPRVISSDDPGQGLLRFSEQTDVQLIALSTHGRGGVARLFLGSVADKLVRGARVPMLITRRPEEERG